MKFEDHLKAFEERKETLFRWGIEVKGLENAQRVIGDNASRAIVDLLSAYLQKHRLVDTGFQLNHRWFKSEKMVLERLPDFSDKGKIITKMVELELLAENLSYGAEKPKEKLKKAVQIFQELENNIRSIL